MERLKRIGERDRDSEGDDSGHPSDRPSGEADEIMTAAALVGGLLVGLLVGGGRAPRRRPGLLLASVLLLAVLLGMLAAKSFALVNALLAGASATLGATAYAASVWKRRIPDPEVSWVGWAWRELVHPRYVREQFEQRGRR